MRLCVNVTIQRGLVCASALLLQACAVSSGLDIGRAQFRLGDTTAALQTLAEAEVSNRDRLLLYLDRGLVAQAAFDYEGSITQLARASALIERLDYVSVSEQTAAILINDWGASYRGEYSEQLWIHTFQMLNYLSLNLPEGAAVEARQALKVLNKHPDALKNDLATRLLMALSFESAGQYDSAGVEYRKLMQRDDVDTGTAWAAWRNARRQGNSEEARRYAALVPDTLRTRELTARSRRPGELVVVLASGFIQKKRQGDLFLSDDYRVSFPFYRTSYSVTPGIQIRLDSPPATERPAKQSMQTKSDAGSIDVNDISDLPEMISTTTLTDVARDSLDARGKSLVARHAIRSAAKYHLSELAGEVDDTFGDIARLAFFLLEQADTRSWETLPGQLSIVRIPLAAGTQSVSLLVDSARTRETISLDGLNIRAGEQAVRLVRTGMRRTIGGGKSDPAQLALPNYTGHR